MRRTITVLLTALLISTAMASGSGVLVSSSQVNMVPGETGYLTLSLTNVGVSVIYDTRIAFVGLENPLSSSEVCNACVLYSNARKSCLEYESDCYVNLGDLYSTNVKSRVYPISIPEDADEGYYIASFQLELDSDTYIDYNVLINVSRVKASFELVVKDLEFRNNGDLSVEVELANVGLTNALGVVLTLTEGDVSVGNIDSKYVGDLTPGEFSKSTFSFNSTKEVNNLVFSVTYTNPSGDRLSDSLTKQVDLSLLSSPVNYNVNTETTRAFVGFNFGTVISYVFIAGVIGLVVFFFLKSRRKKK